MRRAISLLATALAACAGLSAWYHFDQTTLLQSACKVGLPNFSRPAELNQADLGCTVVSNKGIYTGLLVTGFEASSFRSPDFMDTSTPPEQTNDRSWFHCPNGGCGPASKAQLSRDYSGDCKALKFFPTGLATIEVEGWVTVSKGEFGHLGRYRREFYAARILKVGPPPASFVNEELALYRRKNFCD